jgi:dipeptidyl-peptidase-4
MTIKSSFILLILSLFLNISTQAQKQNATLADIYKNGTFGAKSVRGLQSMNDGQHYTAIKKGALVKFSYKTGEAVDTLVKPEHFGNEKIKSLSNYEFSSDEKRILFHINADYIYRHSFIANYFVWDFAEKKLYQISPEGGERLATFSPNGKMVAFIRNNNLFISDLNGNITPVTIDGKENHVINGAPDWVYEEEFGYNQAFEWSPDGTKLAWCRFDESHVKEFNLLKYKGLSPELKENSLYPEVYTFKYPKAGDDNSVVTVHTYDLASKEKITLDVGTETDIYIPRIYWSKKANTLAIIRLNRLQNLIEILFADGSSGKSEVVYSETNKYFIDQPPYENLYFVDSDRFIIFSERDGYNHLYMYDVKKKTTQQITKGNFDVTKFIGYDSKTKTVHYQSTEEGSVYRTIYSVDENGKKKSKRSTRVGTNDAHFSKGFNYYINYFSSSQIPTYVTLHDSKDKLVRTLEDNAELVEKLKEYNISPKEFFTIKTTENVELNAWIVKPANFVESKKYPVMITQYSGPNSQQVLDRWRIDWEQVLAAEGFVVVCVDPRGTGGRGEEFRKMTYKELGKYETIDQIEAAKYLGTLPYVDAAKIGIWGWSYGGFMALNCITQGADHFAAAVAVAPVTNWRYYDNIYTERFMRTPQENPDGYDNNSPINHVDKFRGKLLIVSGTFDDNVHHQNTYEFVEALVQADKQFEMMMYTNRNHSIFGGNTRMHLYTKMVNFFIENLK